MRRRRRSSGSSSAMDGNRIGGRSWSASTGVSLISYSGLPESTGVSGRGRHARPAPHQLVPLGPLPGLPQAPATARMEAGLSQVEVARGPGPAAILRLEMRILGSRRVDVGELEDFARLYRRPLGYFVGGAGADPGTTGRRSPQLSSWSVRNISRTSSSVTNSCWAGGRSRQYPLPSSESGDPSRRSAMSSSSRPI